MQKIEKKNTEQGQRSRKTKKHNGEYYGGTMNSRRQGNDTLRRRQKDK